MSETILIADDEAHIRHVLSMKLTNAGYDVITAEDGEEALEICRLNLPDLLITDYQMPFMDGLELCKRITGEIGPIAILMLTARGFDVGREDILASGISAVLAKPFSPKEVLRKVAEVLEAVEASVSTGR